MIVKRRMKLQELDGEDVIAMKAVGNFEKFLHSYYSPHGFSYVNSKNEFVTDKEYYKLLLNSGKCIKMGDFMIFKEGYHESYEEYANKYLSEINCECSFDLAELNSVSNFGVVNSTIDMVKRNLYPKERAFKIIEKYFRNPGYAQNILNLI
ncbi:MULTISPECIES: hypothetical protein [unclassified Clostridioides]|uniref:hypothetical protein n=1 Tax=unclassified Clostridioides TaxID=2635829 RepID=UPI001D1166DD|nr:hypothetical protein [Clostridioides difficile]MCC0672231.1 hypothetical protein [Clostridioides sp. ES-S-0145-01]MCC0681888.1 hypothetical protein [Clostridioides sp. ES-S-0005-03]MCC0709362.1 hypothetical protein [Clostridioides sp. ES-S-0190-01]UDN64083.1 hypothetical protein IC758_19605 [Clostridioides sp. ES-W-0016-02]